MNCNERIIKVLKATVLRFSFRKLLDKLYPTILFKDLLLCMNDNINTIDHLWFTLYHNSKNYKDLSINNTVSFTARIKENDKKNIDIKNIFHINVIENQSDNNSINQFIERHNYYLKFS